MHRGLIVSNTVYSRVGDNLYMLQYRDYETKYFEGLWHIPEGVTYNSFILETREGLVVFDTWKRSLRGLFIEEFSKHFDVRDVKYLVVHHMEPDHSGSIPYLLASNPEVTVLGHVLSKGMIESFYQVKPRFQPVKDGEVLQLGGFRLRFLHTPWLHWPETIMTYVEEEEALLTCDAFGSYGVPSRIFHDELSVEEKERFSRYMVKYFANIIGHFREWVVKNIEKISQQNLKISAILPAHGVLYRGDSVREVVEKYRSLGAGETVPGKTVIAYTSMYGFVSEVVDDAVSLLDKYGIKPLVYGFTDRERADFSELVADAYQAENLIIATATYEARTFPLMKEVVELIIEKTPVNKNVLVIALYGWGGKAGAELEELLTKNGFRKREVIEFRAGQRENVRKELEDRMPRLLGRR
ncbi:beta-lactamase domain protein [Thermosphaera aggregans DSM 11486]|uniref:Beta-lactamase domain protein n=1 Tax=Thermosphaera aggregans (strain DSM 11486 / M11TL) TaxID=633148 RepID=D5U133_THEAM|nr:beta-lactamase domain protein [Thermosphaera aggregans DSM 11486]